MKALSIKLFLHAIYLIIFRTGILFFYRLFLYAYFLALNPQVQAIFMLASGIELKVM